MEKNNDLISGPQKEAKTGHRVIKRKEVTVYVIRRDKRPGVYFLKRKKKS